MRARVRPRAATVPCTSGGSTETTPNVVAVTTWTDGPAAAERMVTARAHRRAAAAHAPHASPAAATATAVTRNSRRGAGGALGARDWSLRTGGAAGSRDT